MPGPELALSRRTRTTPFTERLERHAVTKYSVYNDTLLADAFAGTSAEDDYWHLRKHVQIWDVSCQRQVELLGPDAAKLTQLMTPRDISKLEIGQCAYAPLIDEEGGIQNDPVILKIAEDRFWLSIASSEIRLWAKGLAHGMNLNVKVSELDVAPLALQGPKAEDLMAKVFGESIRNIRFFRFAKHKFKGHPFIIARSGWSKQGGFEIYLDAPELANDLWDTLWEAGQAFAIAPGYPNEIERLEGGLLSYGHDFTYEHSPLECGLDKYCDLTGSHDYIGKEALHLQAREGVGQKIRGLRYGGAPCPPILSPWPLTNETGAAIGELTSTTWSPALKCNIGFVMIARAYWPVGKEVIIETPTGQERGRVCDLPFTVDPV